MEKVEVKTMRKKGMVDLFYVLVGLFIIGIFLFVVFLAINRIDDSGIFGGYDDAEKMYAHGERALLSFDNMMMFILVGLSLFVIISSAFIWNHPAYFIVGIVLLAVALTIAGVVSNAWFDFSTNAQISGITSSYPKTDFLLSKLPHYILVMGITAAIAMNIGYRRF